MATNNKIFISGKLVRDAAIISGQREDGGTWIKCSLNILVETEIRVRGGEKGIEKMFIDCIVWGDEARTHQGLKEGTLVQVDGRLKMESWTDSTGNKRWKSIIVPYKITSVGNDDKSVKDIEDLLKVTNRKVEPEIKFGHSWDMEDDNDDLPF